MTSTDETETAQETPRPVYTALGFCLDCGLEEADAARWEDRVARGIIAVLDRHGRCNHVLIYRTIKREWR